MRFLPILAAFIVCTCAIITERMFFAGSSRVCCLPQALKWLVTNKIRAEFTFAFSCTGQFIIGLNPDVDPSAFCAKHGLRYIEPLRSVPNTHIVGIPSYHSLYRLESNDIISLLSEGTAFVEEPREMNEQLEYFETDPELSMQWHHAMVNSYAAWMLEAFGANVSLQVIDSGVFPDAADIVDRIDIKRSWNKRQGIGGDPSPDCLAGCNHGTFCATLAAGSMNSFCGRGIAPRMIVGAYAMVGQPGVLSSDYASAYADEFDVSTNSYGTSMCPSVECDLVQDDLTNATTFALNYALQLRGGKGKLLVFSAGNDGRSSGSPNYRSRNNLRQVISVGALGPDGKRASYSNYGPAVFISAPGGESSTENITVGMFGSFRNAGTTTDMCKFNGAGTSYATPLVAGTIGAILGVRPELTWRDVHHILAYSTDITDAASPTWIKNGAGKYFSDYYGFGVVNVARAVGMAKYWEPVAPEVSQSFVATPFVKFNDSFHLYLNVETTIKKVERVVLTLDCSIKERGSFAIKLTSPMGTTAVPFRARIDTHSDYSSYFTLINTYWGENPNGVWRLTFEKDETYSKLVGDVILKRYSITLYGTEK